ncbi:pimeloyl-ACP methyl ester esterase BioH [Colwellia sp. MEBiC06753]
MAHRLNFTSFGQGQTIVLLHGWGLNSGVFQPLAQALAKHFEIILVDLPGYGSNVNHCPKEYSLENIADLIVNSVAKPAIYLGWSLGGLVATEIARKNREHAVHALITVASSPCFQQQEHWPGLKPELLTLFHQQIAQDIEKTLNGFLKIQAMGSTHIKEDIKQIQQLVMSGPLPSSFALDEGLSLLSNIDLRQILNTIDLPFLRIYGKMDGLVPKAVIDKIDQLAPNSESITLEKASHAPFISNFHQFTEILVDWLAQHKLTTN